MAAEIKNYILAKGQKIYLHLNEQFGKSNRPFRFSGTEIVYNELAIWDDKLKMYLHKTIHSFIYLDEQGGMFHLKFDQKGNFELKL